MQSYYVYHRNEDGNWYAMDTRGVCCTSSRLDPDAPAARLSEQEALHIVHKWRQEGKHQVTMKAWSD